MPSDAPIDPPPGAKLAKLIKFAKLRLPFSVQYERNFADDEIGPKDTLRFTVKFLFPR